MTANIAVKLMPTKSVANDSVLKLNRKRATAANAFISLNFSFTILNRKKADSNVKSKGIRFEMNILKPTILKTAAIINI